MQDATTAIADYQNAVSINPTCGKYYSDLGFNVYQRMDDQANTEASLKHAIAD